ncbi:M48 family metallopeptidase [Spartinivicinus ruber]|uniref:M48 family metallopeptidase n=1 Tax=Spartinivicinus ruber TaxID=2683272 RepID=UPI0013D2181A|nr:M48 family metallopeptidase [Spartinivicinus ruber]
MNFFEWQSTAKRKTKILVLLLIVSVIGISLILYFPLLFFFYYFQSGAIPSTEKAYLQIDWMNLPFFFACLAGVAFAVLCGSLFKTYKLSSGGYTVASTLGGRKVNVNTTNFYEKRLLNVVEEMAIASGTTVPDVYILNSELAINAFAAGFQLEDAVIGVTRGCSERLTRDELEGVIAHEFSHIIHGDMRINIRLIGIVFGITMIAHLGEIILRGGHSGRSRESRTFLLGLAFVIAGSIGTFFASWIRSTISRTREYLADASALQYTRNPDGISNALKRIGGASVGTNLESANASEVSHMMFGSSSSGFFASLFASHPPLEKRIKKLQPGWDGRFLPPLNIAEIEEKPEQTAAPQEQINISAATMGFSSSVAAVTHHQLAQVVNHIGQPEPEHIQYAQQLLKALPVTITQGLHSPSDAPLYIMALVFAKEESLQLQQLQLLSQYYPNTNTAVKVEQFANQIKIAAIPDPLALVELAIPALKQGNLEQRTKLEKSLLAIIQVDKKITLFEWAVAAIIKHYFNKWAETHRAGKLFKEIKQFNSLTYEIPQIIGIICRVSGMNAEQQQHCFATTMLKLGIDQDQLPSQLSFQRLYKALECCSRLTPGLKQQFINICCYCIEFNQKVTLKEVQILRAIAILIGCPIPPIVSTSLENH